MQKRAFTLVELLITVSVIAILATLALPNFQAASTRAKVAAAMNNTRTLANALEMYAVDHNVYPPTRPVFPVDQLALMAKVQCQTLTHPIRYIELSSLHDPFADGKEISYFRSLQAGQPAPRAVNRNESLLYFHYVDLADRWNMPCLERQGAAAMSLGPDRIDSLGAYRPFDQLCFSQMYYYSPTGEDYHPINTQYDPTNGTLSLGDIAAFAGLGNQFAHR